MPLIKDGNVYRTYEEQVEHLTKVHREQLTINQNVSRDIQELGITANLGGYNLVRFAFERKGIYYKLAKGTIPNPTGEGSDIGDYFEISSHNSEDIPAYGYLIEGNLIAISYAGDFMAQYSQLAVRNVTKGFEMYDSIEFVEFEGSSLNDYNANDRKKQIFNVIDDLAYGTRTQYASFDLNNDGIYNFVFIGVVQNGKNGTFTYVTNGINVQEAIDKAVFGDLIEFAGDNTTELINPDAVIGDIYQKEADGAFTFMGNIRGEKGEQGEQGIQGEQGVQGAQGVQGIQGEKGDQGDKGEPGNQGLTIYTGVLNSPSELPEFSSTIVGDAYRVINTSGSIVAYDLYFHAADGTDWDIQPNWGGIKGDKGDKGDQGIQGIQGVQGIQGEKGDTGPAGIPGITSVVTTTSNGLMSAGDKTKLNGISSGATKNYCHNIYLSGGGGLGLSAYCQLIISSSTNISSGSSFASYLYLTGHNTKEKALMLIGTRQSTYDLKAIYAPTRATLTIVASNDVSVTVSSLSVSDFIN